MFLQILRLFFKYDLINWNFLGVFSNKQVENCFIYLDVTPTRCAFLWRTHLFLFQRSCQVVLIFTHVERVFLGTPYFAGTSLFVIPFFKSFKALHFTPIGLLFNRRFMCTIFLSQKNKNGFFEFTMVYLCIQKLNARFEKVGMFNF